MSVLQNNRRRVARATLASQIEDVIRADIISGTLEPGRRLPASELSERYGVSATPLREAMHRLATESLVELGQRRGATVAPISTAELLEVYFLRQVLESVAVERSIERSDDVWRSAIKTVYDDFERLTAAGTPTTEEEIGAWSKAHRTFHAVLVQNCGSPWLLRFVGILSDHAERYRMLRKRRYRWHTVHEHRDLYRLVMDGDAGGARDALTRHFAGSVAMLNKLIVTDDLS